MATIRIDDQNLGLLAVSFLRWMICSIVSLKQGAKLRQAVETALQDISLRCANDNSFVTFDLTSRIEAIQLFIGCKEVVGVPFDVPQPYNKLSRNYCNFLRHYFVYCVPVSYSYEGNKPE